MNKKSIVQACLIFIATYSLLFAFGYANKRKFIKNDINKLFFEKMQHIHDSIAKVDSLPWLTTRNFNSYDYFEARPCTIYSEEDTCIVAAKYQISGDQYKHDVQMTQSMFIQSDSYNIAVADSVWKQQLKNAGYNVDVALQLLYKSLFDMFPTPDSLVTNVANTLASNRRLQGNNVFVTDTVALGFCKQGLIVSHIELPTSVVIAKTGFFDWKFVLAATIALLFIVVTYIRYIKANAITKITVQQTTIILGNIIYDCSTHTLRNIANGQTIKLPTIQAKIMELLARAEEHIVTKADICREVWNLNEKDATTAYNGAAWRLRENLQKIDGIRLVTIQNRALQLMIG